MRKMWFHTATVVLFLCLMSSGKCGDSKELDILWEKYGDLRAEVEELKALHRKEKEDSSSEESTEEEESNDEEEMPSNGKNQKKEKNNERGYTEFPVNFRKVEIYSTGSDYKGFTMQIDAPTETRFQCRTEGIPFNVPLMETENTPKAIPNARHEMLDGIHQITCYSRGAHLNVWLTVDSKIYASALFTSLDTLESDLTISRDIISAVVGFRLYDQTENGDFRELRVDFELKNANELNNTEYFGDLAWNNGSRLEFEFSKWDLNENVNLSSTETKLNEIETKVMLAVPTNDVKRLRGTTGVNFNHEVTLRGQTYISLQYGLSLEGKESLLTPFRENDISFFDVKDVLLREGYSEYLKCGANANSRTTMTMFREIENRRERMKNTERLVFPPFVDVVIFFEKVTTDMAGRYVCRAKSGDNVQEVSFNVAVYPEALIAKSSVSKTFNIVTVDLRVVVPGDRNVIAQCNAEYQYGYVIFKERGVDLNQFYINNYTAYNTETWNSSLTSDWEAEASVAYLLQEAMPLVIDYDSSVVVTDKTVKFITVTFDLEMTTYPPSQIACTAFIEGSPLNQWKIININ